jgi:hypothetical protein
VGASCALAFSIAYLADALEFVVSCTPLSEPQPSPLPAPSISGLPTLHQTEGSAMGTARLQRVGRIVRGHGPDGACEVDQGLAEERLDDAEEERGVPFSSGAS